MPETETEDVIKQRLVRETGFFEPTPQWNQERSSDWLWSMERRGAFAPSVV